MNEVKKSLGSEAVDTSQDGKLLYYFLTEDSANHPSPSYKRYVLRFENSILLSVMKVELDK